MIRFIKVTLVVKFLRGLAYYHLTLWWNEVPLRTTPVVDQNSNHVAPSAVDIIYDQIVSDLDYASETLPLVSDSNYEVGRANAMAAHGLLAKVYLKMAGFPLNTSDYKGETHTLKLQHIVKSLWIVVNTL